MELTVSPNFKDKSPAFADEAAKKAALRKTNELLSSLGFFRNLILEHEPQKADVWTHLGLLEHGVSELSELTGYDGMLRKDREARFAETRAANIKIRELEAALGAGTGPDAVGAGIAHYMGVLGTFYSACGFRYASMDPTRWGIHAEFTHELTKTVKRSPFADKKLMAMAVLSCGFIPKQKGWDLERDQFHDSLLDTDRNRKRIVELYAAAFPGDIVREFRSVRDGDKYYLKHEITVGWNNLAAWETRIRQTAKERGLPEDAEFQEETALPDATKFRIP